MGTITFANEKISIYQVKSMFLVGSSNIQILSTFEFDDKRKPPCLG